MNGKLTRVAVSMVCTLTAISVNAQNEAKRPTFDADGTTHVPAFDLPLSTFSSSEAQQQFKFRAQMPPNSSAADPDIVKARQGLDALLAPQVAMMLKAYPVATAEETIAGVPVRVITAKDKKSYSDRVLINLHGGYFTMCWDSCSLLESAPIAALGGYKVVSVNYRMAPEYSHPAGVEDVAKVYRELLKNYSAKHIGIYGCSAGGALAAQSAAWLPAHDLPQAGAVGIFGAGAVPFGAGDSAYIAGYINSGFPPPAKAGSSKVDMTRGYFAKADMSDPIVTPGFHPDVMKKFPPAMILTATRAPDMSPAIVTNSKLLKAGVDSTMIVGEGVGHCYIYSAQLPESQDAYAAIVNFFDKNLK